MIFALIAVAAAVFGIALVIAALFSYDPVELVRDRRLGRLMATLGKTPTDAAEAASLADARALKKRQAMPGLMIGVAPGVRGLLEQAGATKLSPALFWAGSVILGLGVGFLAPVPRFGMSGQVAGLIWAAIVVAALRFAVLRLVAGFMAVRRRNQVLAELPEALDSMVRGLRAGQQLIVAMAMAAEEADGPLEDVLEAAVARSRLGLPIDRALREAGDRLRIPELSMAGIAISVSAATGGGAAEAMSNLSQVIRERRQFALKVKALSAEGRASAWIIGGLPIIMLVMVSIIAPDHTRPLFNDVWGNVMLVMVLVLEIMGIAMLVKMVKIKV